MLHAGSTFHCSNLGVSLFFVLSGFLVLYNHQNDTFCRGQSLRFAIEHIQNIYPLHILTMCSVIVLNIAEPLCYHSLSAANFIKTGVNAILNIFLLQSWIPSVSINVSLNGVAWFLSSLFFCYFMFPTISRLIKRIAHKKSYLFAAIAFVLLLQLALTLALVLFNTDEDMFRWATYDAPFFRLGGFAVGALAAAMVLHEQNDSRPFIKRYAKLVAIAICFVGFATNCWDTFCEPNSVISKMLNNWTTIYVPMAASVVVLFFREKNFLTKSKVLMYIGENSNYFFLIHYAVIKILNSILRATGFTLSKPWDVVMGILISGLFTVLCTELYKSCIKKLKKEAVNL